MNLFLKPYSSANFVKINSSKGDEQAHKAIVTS